ncbi:MAG: gamma-glutamyltransferase [Deltaproteobacteria bacterium]|nr:gamma-glutamyltransferase [Deltaproteobacteria bacterium]
MRSQRTGGCTRVLKKNPEKTALRLPFFLLFFFAAVFTGVLPQTSLAQPTAEQQTDPAKYGPFVATGRQGMVVTAGDQASEAGIEMLRRGGNAVDAAVAASFAISVIRPQSTGIGGGGFFLLYLAKSKETLAIDCRERAPIRATGDMFVRDGKAVADLSRNGPLAVAVPGLVAGLVEIQEKYGTMPLKEVIAPAIRLADQGFPIYPQLAQALAYRAKLLGDSPTTRAIYFREDRPLHEGELLIQKDLAKTLGEIASQGKKAFYQGKVAEALVKEVQARGGLIAQEDLDSYRVRYRPPLTGTFRGAQVHVMPPPSSGGVLILQMLNVLSGFPLPQFGFHTPKAIHLLAETMRLAFRDRARYLGDPDFVQVPTAMLASESYAADLRAKIDLAKATPSEALPASSPGKVESTSTTHLSVIDKAGNAVATTQTVNLYFGSGVMVPGTGVLLNDEMDDFSAQLNNPNAFGLLGETDANAIAPRKTPLSSMSPTIVTRDGKVILIAGSPGGSRIISATLQILLNVLAYDLSLPEGMFAPRIHHQWVPDELLVEVQKGNQPEGLVPALQQMGYKVTLVEDTGDGRTPFGNVQAIQVDLASGQITGVSDPRGEGRPHGF